jgi:hypothetical protein
MPAELPRDKENRPVINNHIADSKSSSNIPPNQTSLGSKGNRNNWDYGLAVVQTPEPVAVVQTPEPVAVVQTPVSVPVEAMPTELPRDLQNPVVVSPVVRLVFSPTPAVNSADVDDEAMAAIGQRVVAEAPCVALEVVAEEQVFEAIDSIPVVPIAPAPQRGWTRWCVRAALTGTNTGVCTTGTGLGACTRTLGRLVRTGRSSALYSGANPNLRLERLSPKKQLYHFLYIEHFIFFKLRFITLRSPHKIYKKTHNDISQCFVLLGCDS